MVRCLASLLRNSLALAPQDDAGPRTMAIQLLPVVKPSKWPRCWSKANNINAGRPAPAHMAKNYAHPVAAAIKPAAEER